MSKKTEIQKIYPLSPMQEGMLYHSLLDKDSKTYFEQICFTFQGNLKLEIFEKSLNILITKHDIFRTNFVAEKIKEPVQVVFKERSSKVYFEDVSQLSEEEILVYVENFKIRDIEKGFDLTKDNLMRISIIKTSEQEYKIIWSHHHIIMDGWCLGIVIKEFFEYYNTLVNGKTIPIIKGPQYGEFIKWIKAQDKDKAHEFWNKYLENYENKISLPKLDNSKVNKNEKHEEVNFKINEELTSSLITLAKQNEATINMLIQSIWGVLLQKYNNVDDVVFGGIVSGRPYELEEVEKIVGLFINNVPIRIRCNKDTTFLQLIGELKENSHLLERFNYASLAEIQAKTKLKQELIDHIVVFENYPMDKMDQVLDNGEKCEFILKNFEAFDQTHYNLDVVIVPSKDLTVKIRYNPSIYERNFIKNIEKHFNKVLKCILQNIEIKINDIELVSDEEKNKITSNFNNTKVEYLKDRSICDMFEEQVEKNTDNIAIVFGDETLTYKELNEKANKLAWKLKEKGVSNNTIVGIMTERSVNMVIGMMAILKSGGAYVPIDLDYPKERVKYLLEQSKTSLLLVNKELEEYLKPEDTEILNINEIINKKDLPVENLNIIRSSEDLMYVLYTSGSTGKPKGAMIKSHAFVNLLNWFTREFKINESDRILLISSASFDLTQKNLFSALITGGRLCIFYPGLYDYECMSQVIEKQGITIINCTPSAFYPLINFNVNNKFSRLKTLTRVFLGGESIKLDKLIPWVKSENYFGEIINTYGPTECTDIATFYRIDNKEIFDLTTVPIGKPIDNTFVYILDKYKNILPEGVVGELYIGGVGVSKGYFDLPNLTKERFIDCSHIAEEKLYRTGDLVKWGSDGNIHFIGRIDNQVKIRGFRIELEEIENCLYRHTGIEEATVITREDSNNENYLCAYIVGNENLDTQEIRQFLTKYLAAYMIPSHFVILDKIPLTPNGKVDRKSLPKPGKNISYSIEYDAPIGKTEEVLVELWKDILQIEQVGVRENFFSIGGHSLKATTLVSRIFKELNVNIPIKKIFQFPTIRELAIYINAAYKSVYSPIKPIEKREYYPVSCAQKRIFLLWQLDPNSTVYNIFGGVTIEGNLNLDKLENTFKMIIQRHEILRTSFHFIDEEIVQYVHEETDFNVDYVEADEKDLKRIAEGFIQPFDLTKESLLRVKLVKFSKEKYLLLTDMHHIISDGTSVSIMINEFIKTLNNKQLSEVNIQYKDYAAWQNELIQTGAMKIQEEYWYNKFKGNMPVINMQTDYPRSSVQSFEGNSIDFKINNTLVYKLNKLASETGTTMYMVLLSAYNILLSKYTGQEDIIVGSAISGRVHADLQNTLGMFINMIAIRNNVNKNRTFRQLLIEIKENVLEVFENQEYQFEELISKLNIQRDMSRNPLFDVVFAMQDKERIDVPNNELSFKPFEMKNKISKFDITLTAFETKNSIEFNVEYCSKLYNLETIQSFMQHYINILEHITINYDIKVVDINMLSEEERNKILINFNDTKSQYLYDKTLQEMFETQVEKTPTQVAVVFEEKQVTYKELNERSNKLARLLKSKGLEKNDVVGVMVGRSIEAIIGILAVLKAGGTYLPIDDSQPQNRIVSILNDSGATVLLTKEQIMKEFSYVSLKNTDYENVMLTVTDPRQQIKDLDSLPIVDRTLVDYKKYSGYIGNAMVKNAISISDSRGCPYKCAYCFKIWPNTYVSRSAENLFEEIKFYYDLGIRRFNFINDAFNLDMKNSGRFFKMIINSGMKVQMFFPSGLRGDRLTKEYIDLLVEAGTVNLALALETASPRLQKLINKNLNLEKFRESVEYISEKYPHVILEMFTMHGLPTETEEEAMMTLDFVKSIKWIDFPYALILKVYPNTDMYKIALDNGISKEAIEKSIHLGFSELPETLPFSKEFTMEYQSKFLNEYILSKDRLLNVISQQKKILTHNEFIQKYNSYLPIELDNVSDLYGFVGIDKNECGKTGFVNEKGIMLPKNFRRNLLQYFPSKEKDSNALNVLLLELNLYFTSEDKHILYDVVEPPLGQMYILSYLNNKFGRKVNGKIAKARIDFDSFDELKKMIDEFKPDIIGIGCLTYYRDFFHRVVAELNQWGIKVPIIAGGPYATSSYRTLLKDANVDFAILGEGEITFSEIVNKMLGNNNKLPDENGLKNIEGIAFVEGRHKFNKKEFYREIISMDNEKSLTYDFSGDNLENISNPNDLAYIMYTSGSTGEPKGVMIEHKGVINLIKWFNNQYYIEKNKNILQITNMAFDVSVEEMFSVLLNGGKLYISSMEIVLNKEKFLKYVNDNNINIAQFVPVTLNELLINNEKMESLNIVICGGDRLDEVLKDKIIAKGYRLFNHYGPTEITVDAITFECTDGRVKLGKPISNTKVYVLNSDNKLNAIGIPGELCISGAGLARGYLNRAQLTKEKFVDNPFINGEKMYKTGDLARWLPDGNIEFLGRIDNQVKIRGFRIELGEIEKFILKYEGIKEVVVIDSEDDYGDRRLCAYMVSNKQHTVEDIRNYLSIYLPQYMIPSCYIYMDKIPHNSSGKVDKKALPKPDGTIATRVKFDSPQNEIEKRLAKIWSNVLGIDSFGVNDKFFDLGGHSLKATKLISKIYKEFNVDIPLKEFFNMQTLRNVRMYIEKAEKRMYLEIKKTEKRESYPVSSGQKLMYIEEILNDLGMTYNMPMAVEVDGEIDRLKFEASCNKLVKRHESLRTFFELVNGNPVQKIQDDLDFKIGYIEADESKSKEVINKFIQKFNLEEAPLFRINLIKVSKSKYIILFDMHHIISDGVSMKILIKDLISIYNGEELTELNIQYKEFCVWQNEMYESKRMDKLEGYWMDVLSNDIPILDMPTDYQRENMMRSFEADRIIFEIDEETTFKLKEILIANDVTMYTYFVSVYNILLSKYSNQEDIIIGTPSAGRQQVEIENVIGMFINMVPIRNKPMADKTFIQFLNEVNDNCLKAFENQDYKLEMILDKLKLKRNLGRNPLFDTTFVVHNEEKSSVGIDGLKFNMVQLEKNTTPYEIVFEAIESKDKVAFSMQYSIGLYTRESMGKFCQHYLDILKIVMEYEEIKLIDIELETEYKEGEQINENEDLCLEIDLDF